MKVIKPGNKEKPLRITCQHCEAVVECMKNELRFEADERDGDAYVMRCPECGGETWQNVNPAHTSGGWWDAR